MQAWIEGSCIIMIMHNSTLNDPWHMVSYGFWGLGLLRNLTLFLDRCLGNACIVNIGSKTLPINCGWNVTVISIKRNVEFAWRCLTCQTWANWHWQATSRGRSTLISWKRNKEVQLLTLLLRTILLNNISSGSQMVTGSSISRSTASASSNTARVFEKRVSGLEGDFHLLVLFVMCCFKIFI